jgi:hypothetical protein
LLRGGRLNAPAHCGLWLVFVLLLGVSTTHRQIDNWTLAPHKAMRRELLSDPKLDRLVNAATVAVVIVFPALLWLPLIFWLLTSQLDGNSKLTR